MLPQRQTLAVLVIVSVLEVREHVVLEVAHPVRHVDHVVSFVSDQVELEAVLIRPKSADELTACRDENCDKDAIAPDVAHSAFILQGMTGAAARPQQTEHQHYENTGEFHFLSIRLQFLLRYIDARVRVGFHQTLMDSNIDFFHCDHTLPYTSDGDDVYQHCFHSHGALEQFGQCHHASQQGLSCRPSAQMFPGGLNDHFGFTTHGHGLGGDMFNLDQAMSQVNQDAHYHFGLAVGTQHYFTHATGEAHSHQVSTTNQSSGTTPVLPATLTDGHAISATYASNSVVDDSSVLTPELSDTTMQETSEEVAYLPDAMVDAVKNDDTCLSGDISMHSGLQTQEVCKKEPNLPIQCKAADNFPSPPSSDPCYSDVQMPNSTPKMDQIGHKDAKVHMCRWTCADETEICGQQFANPKLLWDHVVEFHVDMLQKTQHGYICEWKGCDRRHRSDDSTKIGFHQKSKIKRHMETHTGSGR